MCCSFWRNVLFFSVKRTTWETGYPNKSSVFRRIGELKLLFYFGQLFYCSMQSPTCDRNKKKFNSPIQRNTILLFMYPHLATTLTRYTPVPSHPLPHTRSPLLLGTQSPVLPGTWSYLVQGIAHNLVLGMTWWFICTRI